MQVEIFQRFGSCFYHLDVAVIHGRYSMLGIWLHLTIYLNVEKLEGVEFYETTQRKCEYSKQKLTNFGWSGENVNIRGEEARKTLCIFFQMAVKWPTQPLATGRNVRFTADFLVRRQFLYILLAMYASNHHASALR